MSWQVEIVDPDRTHGHFVLARPSAFEHFQDGLVWAMNFARDNPADQGQIVVSEVDSTEKETGRLVLGGTVEWDAEQRQLSF